MNDTEVGVRFELTADAHSRKAYFNGAFVGTLLFHDWEFKLDLGPAIPLSLKTAERIHNAALEDSSILYQKTEDKRATMAKNARQALENQGIKTDGMTDQGALEAYLTAPNEQRS